MIQSLEKEFPTEFVCVMHKQGYITKASNQLGDSDVIALASEVNLKTKQLRVIHEFIRQMLGGKIMCKEEDIRSKMTEIKGELSFRSLMKRHADATQLTATRMMMRFLVSF